MSKQQQIPGNGATLDAIKREFIGAETESLTKREANIIRILNRHGCHLIDFNGAITEAGH